MFQLPTNDHVHANSSLEVPFSNLVLGMALGVFIKILLI